MWGRVDGDDDDDDADNDKDGDSRNAPPKTMRANNNAPMPEAQSNSNSTAGLNAGADLGLHRVPSISPFSVAGNNARATGKLNRYAALAVSI